MQMQYAHIPLGKCRRNGHDMAPFQRRVQRCGHRLCGRLAYGEQARFVAMRERAHPVSLVVSNERAFHGAPSMVPPIPRVYEWIVEIGTTSSNSALRNSPPRLRPFPTALLRIEMLHVHVPCEGLACDGV